MGLGSSRPGEREGEIERVSETLGLYIYAKILIGPDWAVG